MDINLLSSKCLSCPIPKCELSCPCGNHIRDFIKAVKDGDEDKAASILYSVNPFPEITSLLCDHKRQCYGHCIKNRMGDPVPVFEIEHELSLRHPRPLDKMPFNGKKVIIIGAGPAGLSAAYFLAKKGFAVDIYEKDASCGGAIHHGIPDFRFNKEPLIKIQSDLMRLGVAFHFGVNVGKDIKLEELKKQCNALIISIGAEKENKAFLTDSPGIEGGLSYLSHPHDKPVANQVAYCWGGGNVAIDCARTLLREYGNATIIYRRDRSSMPASEVEIEEALREGVKLQELTNIQSVTTDGQRLVGLTLVDMKLGEPDASGRPSFSVISGTERIVKADKLVYALGEKADLKGFEDIALGEDKKSPNEGYYFIGDVRTGPRNIAAAIREGREVAALIEEDLKG